MVGRDEQHPGGEGHHEQGQLEYLSSQVNIPHPHEHLLLQLVKPRPVLSSIFQSLAGFRDQVGTVVWQLVITYSRLLLCRMDFRVFRA